MLRHVEVLSCVSGGSIIGALYYLKVRKLLESKPDNDITPADYIQIVREMEEELTVVTEHNPRRQVFSQLALLGTRTEEMGKLLDTTPYGAAAGLPIGERPQLRHLIIRPPFNQAEVALPPEDRSPFVPKYDNWRRAHKVPATAPSAGMCSALYHSLKSLSCSGAMFIAMTSSAVASVGAVRSPGNSCSPSYRIRLLRNRAVRLVQGEEFSPPTAR